MKRDNELTDAAELWDNRSYVAPDGREVLYSLDWKERKAELWRRCGGRCEQIVDAETGERCRNEGQDPHHVIPRSKGRDDRLSNLLCLCRMHHELLDKRKIMWRKS